MRITQTSYKGTARMITSSVLAIRVDISRYNSGFNSYCKRGNGGCQGLCQPHSERALFKLWKSCPSWGAFGLGIAPRTQLLKKSARLLHLIGDKAPPAARDCSEVPRAFDQRCYPHPGKGCAQLVFEEKLILVGRNFHRGLTTMRAYLLSPLTGN